MIDGILYANDGDWVESLTALAEHADGRLEIIDWSKHTPRRGGRAGGRGLARGGRGVRIAIVSDAWTPQVNGVVTVLVDLRERLVRDGTRGRRRRAFVVSHDGCPGYRRDPPRLARRAR